MLGAQLLDEAGGGSPCPRGRRPYASTITESRLSIRSKTRGVAQLGEATPGTQGFGLPGWMNWPGCMLRRMPEVRANSPISRRSSPCSACQS